MTKILRMCNTPFMGPDEREKKSTQQEVERGSRADRLCVHDGCSLATSSTGEDFVRRRVSPDGAGEQFNEMMKVRPPHPRPQPPNPATHADRALRRVHRRRATRARHAAALCRRLPPLEGRQVGTRFASPTVSYEQGLRSVTW